MIVSPETEPQPDLTFNEMLEAKWDENKFVSVGLDLYPDKLPDEFRQSFAYWNVINFNNLIVDATIDVAAAYKPDLSFYLPLGSVGVEALAHTVKYIKHRDRNMPVILDAKWAGGIAEANEANAVFSFERIGADAVTVVPFGGPDAMRPFTEQADKGVIVLVRTSGEMNGRLQKQRVQDYDPQTNMLQTDDLYRFIAAEVVADWNYNNNCAVVVAATDPDALSVVRQTVGELPMLVPGIGAQHGNLQEAVANGLDGRGRGIIINSSRGIVYPKPHAGQSYKQAVRQAALFLHDQINQIRAAA